MIYSIEGRRGIDTFVKYLIKEKISTSDKCFSNADIEGCSLFTNLEDLDFNHYNKSNQVHIFYTLMSRDLTSVRLPKEGENRFFYNLREGTRREEVHIYFIARSPDVWDKRIRRSIDHRFQVLSSNGELYYRSNPITLEEDEIEETDVKFGEVVNV